MLLLFEQHEHPLPDQLELTTFSGSIRLIPRPPSPGGEGGNQMIFFGLAPLLCLAPPKRLRKGEGRGVGVNTRERKGASSWE